MTVAPARSRAWVWSTPGDAARGVERKGNRFRAWLSLHGRVIRLGSFRYEAEAARLRRKADELKLAGRLDHCASAAQVRAAVASAA